MVGRAGRPAAVLVGVTATGIEIVFLVIAGIFTVVLATVFAVVLIRSQRDERQDEDR